MLGEGFLTCTRSECFVVRLSPARWMSGRGLPNGLAVVAGVAREIDLAGAVGVHRVNLLIAVADSGEQEF